MIALTASALFTPLERLNDPIVLLDDGVITRISSRREIEIPAGARVVEFGNGLLAPGLIDLHIHGAAGHDVMESDSDALACIERFLFQHGVSSYLPTTVTAPMPATLAAVERLADAIEEPTETDRAHPMGVHLEGPFLSHARRGVHPAEYLVEPTMEIFERLWEAARGHIKMLTIAPELDGALKVIEEATKRGVCISLGHSDAHLEQARKAVDRGARHATHTFNAMRPIAHRDPGIIELVLSDDRMSADIIVDGFHVDPAVVKLFMRAKTAERAVLITDALSAAGMPEGKFRLGEMEIEVQNGTCTSGGRIAGSVLTMDQAVRNTMKFAEVDLQYALRAASTNPAKAAGLAGKGKLEVGAAADFVVFNKDHEVVRTIVGGIGL